MVYITPTRSFVLPTVSADQPFAVATPPDITYETPDPDSVENSPLPEPEDHTRPEMGEQQQRTAAMDASRRSHSFDDAYPSPSSSTFQWAPSLPMPWPAGAAHNSTSTAIDASFGSHTFPEAGMLDTSHAFAGDEMRTVFPAIAWAHSATNKAAYYYPCPTPTDEPPSWEFASQQSQNVAPTLESGLDGGISSSSSGYSSYVSRTIPIVVRNSIEPVSPAGVAAGRTTAPDLELTELHTAVIRNDFNLAQRLLEQGANANCATRCGTTPLHFASYQRNVELVNLLKSYGANLDSVTDQGRSILFFAVHSHGALDSGDMPPYDGQSSPPENGIFTDDATMRVIDALYDSPAGWICLRNSLGRADKSGITPLMVAAAGGFTQTVTMFLQRGAQPDAKDHDGYTALMYAARGDHRHLIRMLLEADEGVQKRDLAHLLKLASKNFASGNRGNGRSGRDDQLGAFREYHSALIAEEMVRLCHEMGILDGLLGLADQKLKVRVLGLLTAAMSRLGVEQQQGFHAADGS